MTRKQQRAAFIFILLCVAAFAASLILYALNDNIVFFLSPSEIAAKHPPFGQRFRLGGLVQEGSLKRDGDTAHFMITDGNKMIPVVYSGPLPDLFREKQGAVAEGRLLGDLFHADTILAKHDENYMPREVVDALKKQGRWRGP